MDINHAALAFARLIRLRRRIRASPLPDMCVTPPTAQQVGASDGLSLSQGPSSDPRGSAVEAGRSANQSDLGDECDCPVCTSDCARVKAADEKLRNARRSMEYALSQLPKDDPVVPAWSEQAA